MLFYVVLALSQIVVLLFQCITYATLLAAECLPGDLLYITPLFGTISNILAFLCYLFYLSLLQKSPKITYCASAPCFAFALFSYATTAASLSDSMHKELCPSLDTVYAPATAFVLFTINLTCVASYVRNKRLTLEQLP